MEMLRKVLRANSEKLDKTFRVTAAPTMSHTDYDWFVVTTPFSCYRPKRNSELLERYVIKPAGEGENRALCGFRFSSDGNAYMLRYIEGYDENKYPIFVDFTIPIRALVWEKEKPDEAALRRRQAAGESVLRWLDNQQSLGKGRRPRWMLDPTKPSSKRPKATEVAAPEVKKAASTALPKEALKKSAGTPAAAPKAEKETPKNSAPPVPTPKKAPTPAAKPEVPVTKTAKPAPKEDFPDGNPLSKPTTKIAPKGDSSKGDDDDDFGGLPMRKK